MLMTTIVAIALGFAPVDRDGSVAPAKDNYATLVGNFTQIVDRDGNTHLRGFNRLNGAAYDLTVKKDGQVQGDVGAFYVTFGVKEVA